MTNNQKAITKHRPEWLKKRVSVNSQQKWVRELLKYLNLHTVCQSAVCPNIAECFGKGTATFLILGNTCTRNCRFCAVNSGEPEKVDGDEPKRLATAVQKLNLKHVVITSVTRDDLSDGGAGHFARTISEIHGKSPETTVEVLTPDFQGDIEALKIVLERRPDIFNHNVETVPRLYSSVRPMADYQRSLDILAKAKEIAPDLLTKSGIMLGLGETRKEVSEVIKDLLDAGCDILTVGQYLSPSKVHFETKEYIRPEVFDDIKKEAQKMGFKYVASAPFVRSSFNAKEAFDMIKGGNK
ncbi:lipoyl synthase [Candidatus Poribacteria bacterium]|nr:lipoyl synthase [Candidatus Poribacteria bacterium]